MSFRRLTWTLLAAVLLAASGTVSAQPAGPPPDEPAPPPGASPAAPPQLRPAPPEEPPPPGSDSLPGSAAPAKPAPPRRTLYTAAVIQVLDKVTAEGLRFEAPLHKFIRYKGLIFLVNTCQTDSEDHTTAAHLEIDSRPPALPGRPPNAVKLVFRGWMFADSPGAHPFEHPVYDAWLIACKTASPGA